MELRHWKPTRAESVIETAATCSPSERYSLGIFMLMHKSDDGRTASRLVKEGILQYKDPVSSALTAARYLEFTPEGRDSVLTAITERINTLTQVRDCLLAMEITVDPVEETE